MSENTELADIATRLSAETNAEATAPESPTEEQAPEQTAEKPDTNTDSENPEFPTDPKEIGKAFAAMRHEIKELKALKEEAVVSPEGADFTPSLDFNPAPGLDQSKYVDANGYFDVQAYDRDAQAKTVQTAQAVARATVQEERQTAEVLSAYPELNPESKEFNKPFYQAVRGVLLDAVSDPKGYGGKVPTYKEAADLITGLTKTVAKKAEEAGAKKATEALSAKEQADLSATTSSAGRSTYNFEQAENLRNETRKGNDVALAERLKNF